MGIITSAKNTRSLHQIRKQVTSDHVENIHKEGGGKERL